MTEIADTARRMAADIRAVSGREDSFPRLAGYACLLPVLDAVAAEPDWGRVERWARTLDPALWAKVDGESSVLDPATIEYGRIASLDRARAAIALADAEATARAEAGWRAYEEARSKYARACAGMAARMALPEAKSDVQAFADATIAVTTASATLDAAVKAMGWAPETKKAPLG